MPVATQATLKGLTPDQLEQTGCRLCLNNTYHLGLKPGQKVLDHIGGAHKLQGWNRNILTDSGGFQMVSLLKLAKITEEGVRFLSPHDATPMLLTPEHSISLQNSIGSDIIMQLDDVIAATSPDQARMTEAMQRSVRWLDRCIAAHKKPESQNLFCIIQGGLDLELRRACCVEMVKRDTPGIAIGGLSGGEEKEKFCSVVDTCTGLLPEGKPRYVMGVGYQEDLMVAVALGADMFDCVWPTRSARFGHAITSAGTLNIRHASFATDFSSIEPDCECRCCRPVDRGGLGVTKALMCHLAGKETAGAHLLTIHNVHYQLALMKRARSAIMQDRFPAFLRAFFQKLYGHQDKYPGWVVGALRKVGVDLFSRIVTIVTQRASPLHKIPFTDPDPNTNAPTLLLTNNHIPQSDPHPRASFHSSLLYRPPARQKPRQPRPSQALGIGLELGGGEDALLKTGVEQAVTFRDEPRDA
ncbi:MAG: hypothetical protein M1814_001690 [Vezdaea aestivalis]|nr:MAG: hypothetical protein M1814_001690 [Vezdaea aestivalis]